MTLDLYGHLYDDDLEALAERSPAGPRGPHAVQTLWRCGFAIASDAPKPLTSKGFGEAPGVGLEPTTCGLTVRCSAS